ncbi:hypothetical protein FRB94_008915 [Tulasnella sp. JGI-2019a]|nr:hypothetical protein FRB93_008551 [Tulasnella sp. JGI-2019a]KAG8995633.1 hypothetical protein FRB94_008915 [Tulasnella sp. JGI-2019a]KAG9027262.1 hypothetical protein FRB95_007945 [Tulasnella sp. JGI-2019a]
MAATEAMATAKAEHQVQNSELATSLGGIVSGLLEIIEGLTADTPSSVHTPGSPNPPNTNPDVKQTQNRRLRG